MDNINEFKQYDKEIQIKILEFCILLNMKNPNNKRKKQIQIYKKIIGINNLRKINKEMRIIKEKIEK